MSLAATLSGPDLTQLMAAVIDATPYARGLPTETVEKWVTGPPVADWRERLVTDGVDGLVVGWGGTKRIGRNTGSVVVTLPEARVDPETVFAYLATLPFEIAVLPCIHDYWPEHDYYAPTIGSNHAPLGWGIVFKGAGHERSLVSRRWLEQGPYRTLRGPDDTTLVQFHDLATDGATSLAQAEPGHTWLAAGFLRPKHRFQHDIEGVFTDADGLLRIVVHDRPIDDAELVDACAARRDRHDDPDRPIQNIAYVFVDDDAARSRLEALWLRGLECRVVSGSGERRLDDGYEPSSTRPAWVAAR